MRKILLSKVEEIQVDTEQDAKQLIEEYSTKQFQEGYRVVDSRYKYRNKKVKGEIVEEWYIVTVKLSYEVE